MKKFLTLSSAILFALLLCSGIGMARSSATDYKNPEINLAQIEEIIIEPILYGPNVNIDDFDRLRIEASFRESLHNLPIPLVWSTGNATGSSSKHQARLLIYVKSFHLESRPTKGRYESYTVNRPISIIDDYSWTRDGRRRYWRSQDRFESRTYYVEPEERFQARVEVQLTLKSMDHSQSYWIYNQERFDTNRNSSPDKSLKIIAKDGIKKFRNAYQKDEKIIQRRP